MQTNGLPIEDFNSLDLSYRVYKRKKKNKGYRVITAPNESLKLIQSQFAKFLYEKNKDLFDANPHITGFLPGLSIKDNADPHLGSEWILNLDLKDFFPSITEEFLVDYYRDLGFKFNATELGKITCYQGKLAQGSPSSPVIANLIALLTIDDKIKKIAEGSGFKYTRYADDLTFSIKSKCDRSFIKGFARYVTGIVSSSGIFEVNNSKVNIKHCSQRQMVTGVLVNNEDPGVSRPVRNKLRAILHQHKIQDKPLDDKIYGVLSFIKQINKDQYQKLTKDFPCKLLTSDYLSQTLPQHQLQKHMDNLS